jgi:glycine dehydrogenase subunit 1
MAFIPHTADDIARMLEVIGAKTVDDLFDEIPAELRAGTLSVPSAIGEMELGRLMSDRAASDGRPLNFIGAGAYEHHIPAPVWAITTRGEF